MELAAAGLCAATLGAAACGALARGEDLSSGPVLCPFRLVTGLPCPFCGMTRSLLALGQGDLGASVRLHPLGPVLVVVAVLGLWRFGRAAAAKVPARLPRGALAVGGIALAIAWLVQLVPLP
ncbi:MAG: DUF2752 domain-containing protein [Solirubrobacteraceae bacterium]